MPKILAVDDDINILASYRAFFTGEGFEVHTAEDASSAITAYQQSRPDIIILDVDMPGGSGLKVFERLRADAGDNTPIIFFTGKPERVAHLADRRLVVIIKKPAAADMLLAEINKLLADAADRLAAAPKTAQKTRILAVDDDLCLLELYREIFSKAGFEIETAEDAAAAISKFQAFKPALLILDVDMPAGGGQKVFDRMRNLFQDATPIIFSTGKPESVQALAKNHNVLVLKKPVNPETLIAETKKLLKLP